MKRIISALFALLMLFAMVSCTKGGNTEASDEANNQSAQTTTEQIRLPDVVTGSMIIMGLGELKFEVYPNKVPNSALNFIYLVNKGHFNGVIIDKIQKNLLIQAGSYESGFVPRNTEQDYTIKGEFSENGFDNPFPINKGAMVWMIKGQNYDSAHTEFAIFTTSDAAQSLKGKYAVFGYVTGDDSFAILDKINKRKTYEGKPNKELVITSVVLNPIEQEGFDDSYKFPEPVFIIREQ